MAMRINNGLDTITAGKVVTIKNRTQDLKAMLARVSQSVSSSDANASIVGIGQIASDNVITPDEKKALAAEWQHIAAAYASTVSTVNELGVNPSEFIQFQSAYSALKSMMESILADMDTSTSIDNSRLTNLLNSYNTSATILQNWINAYMNNLTADVSRYRTSVSHTPSMPSLDSTIVFTAHIYIDGIDKTEALIEANRNDSGLCPDLFDWTISGTSDDEGLMEQSKGIRTISIPASSFVDDNVRVSFVSILNIG